MQYSALVILACALVSAARPLDGSAVDVNAPVVIKYALDDNHVAAGNNILNRDAAIDVWAPVVVKDVGNDNTIKIANGGKHPKRGDGSLISINAPIWISNILNCNTIEVANDILNGLAAAIGCLVSELGVTVEDILGCDEENWPEFVAKLKDGKTIFGKRGAVEVVAPVKVFYDVDHNDVSALNDVLNGKHPKRGDGSLIDIYAPITIEDILNCNTIEVANHILNGLALELGCLVSDLLITVADILDCNASNWPEFVAKLKDGHSLFGKRDLVSIHAPIWISDILNCNTIEVANDILNGLALELGCLVKDLGITVADILGCNTSNWPEFVAKLKDGKTLFGKRGLVSIDAPITVKDILNCNDIEIANDILNGLALELGCLVEDLGITVADILGCNTSNWSEFVAKLKGGKTLFGKRGLVSVNIPITIKNILNCNTIKVANDILNGLAVELGCLIEDLGVTIADILDCNASNWPEFVAKLKDGQSLFGENALA